MSKRDIDRHAVIKKYIDKEISRSHAADVLKLTERHVTRLKLAIIAFGASALIHKQRGKPSHHRLDDGEREKIILLLKEKYPDFGPTFAAEKLLEVHKIDHDPKTIRSIQIAEGLWKPRRSRAKSGHRSWRQRRSAYGEMEQFDGCYHDWFEGRGDVGTTCLLAAIDDATGRVTGAEFRPHEGVFPVFAFWRGYLEKRGKPRSIYMDRFSTYKMNHAKAKENPDLKTQFQRALEELGIEPIFARSPEAKGRVERLFRTFQDRLVKELRLRGVSTVEEANCFLEEEFIPAFNSKFSVEPASPADLHTKLTKGETASLSSVFSRQEERVVNNDFTFSFKNHWYQLTEKQPATVCKKDVIMLLERADGTFQARLRGKFLNFTPLPERPRKATVPFALPKTDVPVRKPATDHPWRGCFHADALKRIRITVS